ncbi:MAG: hypothetical protein HEEMFOPI_00112 [Holosporales bacterium]
MVLIITRPKENVSDLDAMSNICYQPLFSYEHSQDNFSDVLQNVKHFILTSQEASRFILKHSLEFLLKESTFYCVGKKTARPLLDKEYKNIVIGDSPNAQSLFQKIKSTHPKSAPLAYLSGDIIKEYLHDQLTAEGFSCSRFIVYKTHPLHFDFKHIQNQNGAIVFYSLGTYQIFLKNIEEQNITDKSCFLKWTCIFVIPNHLNRDVFSNLVDINWKKNLVLESTLDLVRYLKGNNQ